MTIFKKSLLIFKLVLLTGFLASCGENKETPKSEPKVVMASDVKDKASLKAFVDQAKEHLDRNYDQAIKDFSGLEKWKKDSIYLYIISGEGLSVFHPTLQGQNIMGLTDPNGVKITEELLKAGKAGGGFVEYKWDNPAVENDNGNSDKVGYVVPFTKDDKFHILGSGIYLEYTGAETTTEIIEATAPIEVITEIIEVKAPIEATATIDIEALVRVIRGNRNKFERCYQLSLNQQASLQGKLTMKWMILENGKTINARAVESEMDSRTLENCVAGVLESLTFPKPPAGLVPEVEFTFTFIP